MRVEVGSRAPHARKHGATFAETWTCADGSTAIAVGAVVAGEDPIVVGDLLRAGARAVLTSRTALASALAALDRIVQSHAKDHRDDALAAAVALLAFAPDEPDVEAVIAGQQLHVALIDGSGASRALHGHAGALGTGLVAGDLAQRERLRRDDLLVAATFPLPPAWWDAGDRGADALIRLADAREASAAIVAAGAPS